MLVTKFEGASIATRPAHSTDDVLKNFAKDAHQPLRLRVVKGNPAIRLYERLGFHITKSDQIASEMEWLPLNAVQAMYLQASVPHGSI